MLLLCLVAISTKAQRLSHDFQGSSLSEALIWIDNAQDNYKLNFIFDELEDFTVTTQLKNVSVRDAVRQVCGFYPMHLTFDEQDIYIECIQKADTKLSGRITNENGQPIAYASVSLFSLSDSVGGDSQSPTFLTGGVSNEAGDFVIPCKAQKVIARITCIGYKTIEATYSMGHIGEIRMQPDKYALQGVEVKGSKRLVYATDRGLKVNVRGSYLEQFGSVSDMLTHLPLVMSDGSVAGRGTPEIYINNKKVRDNSELERLRADEILSAEIITTPGAEYGAEVTSVIRLKTIRKSGEGWSGSASATYRQGEQWTGRLNAALNYRTRNGMDFFAKGVVTEDNSLMTYPAKTELKTSSTWNYEKDMKWHNRNRYYHIDFGWNWDISDKHSVGITYSLNSYLNGSRSNIEQGEKVSQNGILKDDVQTSTVTDWIPKMSHSLNAYYVGEIGKWKFDFSGDYYGNQNLSEMNGFANGVQNATSKTHNKSTLLAEKLVITAPVPKGNLTFGEEVSNVDRSSDFRQNGFSTDNLVHQQTTTWSIFGSYGLRIKKFTLNASLRWQNEHNRYEQNGLYVAETSPDYHVLIPRVAASYSTGSGWTHTLSYEHSRLNPPYNWLSSSVTYAGKYEYRSGNPFLKPQTHRAVSWESQWKWLYVGLGYDHVRNRYNDFKTAYDDSGHPGIILMSFTTVPKIDFYQLILSASPKIGIWQMNYTAFFNVADADLEPLGITHNFKGVYSNFSLDNTFTLPKDWTVNVQMSLVPYHKSEYRIAKTAGSLDFRISKQLLKGKSLRIALVASDILHTSVNRGTAYNGIGYRSESDIYRDQRRIGLDLSWKFNATKSRYKGSHAGQSERNRL